MLNASTWPRAIQLVEPVWSSTTLIDLDQPVITARPGSGPHAVTTEFTRFVVAADDDTAAVDATGRYTGRDGTTSVVSSCDIFEFHEGLIVRITSYAVEEEAR